MPGNWCEVYDTEPVRNRRTCKSGFAVRVHSCIHLCAARREDAMRSQELDTCAVMCVTTCTRAFRELCPCARHITMWRYAHPRYMRRASPTVRTKMKL